MNFYEKLEAQCRAKNSLLCVGLDPVVKGTDVYTEIVDKNRKIIEETADYCVCYKPNIAFYEAYGEEGMKALRATLDLIPKEIPVLLDAKRGDIGNTAQAYAKAAFDVLGADAVTLSPYMGFTSAEPFLKYEDKGFFELCRTSNPGAERIQKLTAAETGEPLFVTVAKEACSWSPQVGLVVAGNDPESLSAVRRELPDVWFLAPGFGAQGGSMYDAVRASLRSDGLGVLPVVVRAICEAPDIRKAAADFCDELNRAREAVLKEGRTAAPDMLKQQLLKGLIDTECFRLGEFILKSGIKSPFYIDLRRTSSDPQLMKTVGKAYARLIGALPQQFDRVAGIPVAAVSLATAASMETGIPMIYPRINKKEHGTGNLIEGNFKPGERVVLLDDLITTGKSKIEAIEILREAGLIVEDLVVLLERGEQGRRDMEAAGVRLHSFFPVEDLFDMCRELGIIDENGYKELLAFVHGN